MTIVERDGCAYFWREWSSNWTFSTFAIDGIEYVGGD
jgi:hypothetical protein